MGEDVGLAVDDRADHVGGRRVSAEVKGIPSLHLKKIGDHPL